MLASSKQGPNILKAPLRNETNCVSESKDEEPSLLENCSLVMSQQAQHIERLQEDLYQLQSQVKERDLIISQLTNEDLKKETLLKTKDIQIEEVDLKNRDHQERIQSLEFDSKERENLNVHLQEKNSTLGFRLSLLQESRKSERADLFRLKQLEIEGISVEQQIKSLNLDLKDKENRNVLLQEEIGTLRCNYNLLTDYTKSVEADSWRLEQLETGGISVEQQIEVQFISISFFP